MLYAGFRESESDVRQVDACDLTVAPDRGAAGVRLAPGLVQFPDLSCGGEKRERARNITADSIKFDPCLILALWCTGFRCLVNLTGVQCGHVKQQAETWETWRILAANQRLGNTDWQVIGWQTGR